MVGVVVVDDYQVSVDQRVVAADQQQDKVSEDKLKSRRTSKETVLTISALHWTGRFPPV